MPLYLSVSGLASGHITKVPDFSLDIINKDVFVMGCGCAWVLKCVALKVVFNNLKLGCFVTITLIEFALEKINCSKKFGEKIIVSVHCREEGCIGKYIPRGQSRGPRGAKSPPEGNLEGRGGCISQCIPTRGSVRPFSHH